MSGVMADSSDAQAIAEGCVMSQRSSAPLGDEQASMMSGSGQVVLVANRAEIACRIIKACHKLHLKAVAVYTEAGVCLVCPE